MFADVVRVKNAVRRSKTKSAVDAIKMLMNVLVERRRINNVGISMRVTESFFGEKMPNNKVLIVDDDKEFLEELDETLRLAGYDTVAVSDVDGIVNTATAVKPDVVLLDLKMPKKTGFQVAFELRLSHDSDLSFVPIIIMTGAFKDDFSPLMNICNIKRCINKPFNPLDIVAEIETVLAEK